jgi:hypothetical protein
MHRLNLSHRSLPNVVVASLSFAICSHSGSGRFNVVLARSRITRPLFWNNADMRHTMSTQSCPSWHYWLLVEDPWLRKGTGTVAIAPCLHQRLLARISHRHHVTQLALRGLHLGLLMS